MTDLKKTADEIAFIIDPKSKVISGIILAGLMMAVAAERERCAGIAADLYRETTDPDAFETGFNVACADIFNAIRAGQPQPSAWRPIKTAPKDGTWFWGRIDDDAIAMFWHEGFGEFVSSFNRMTTAPGYTFEDGSTHRDHSPVAHKPTHWQPLPQPPEATS